VSFVGVCSKLVWISMAVAVICNNSKLASELVKARVSKVSKSFKEESLSVCLTNHSQKQVDKCLFGLMESITTTI
jgi:hypothetical protein